MRADLLREKMRQRGLNQQQLAEMAGITAVSMCRKLKGKRGFLAVEMLRMQKGLQLTKTETIAIFAPELLDK